MMSPKVIICKDRDHQKWDEYVSAHAHGHFMQSWAWGVFKETQGWHPMRFLALRNGSPCGAMQVLARRVFGKECLLYAPRGPVLDMSDLETMNSLLYAVKSYYSNAITLRMDPYVREGEIGTDVSRDLQKLPEEWSFWNCPKYVFWLDTSGGSAQVFDSFGTKQRNQINYPAKRGVTFAKGGVDDVDDFYRLMVSMSQQKGIACHSKTFFQNLFKVFCNNEMADISFAEVDGERIACGMSLRFGNKSWLMYAATDENGHNFRSSRAVQWEMIKSALDSGCKRYDFRGTATGRTPSLNDPGYGVYEFKKKFGPEFVFLDGYYDYVLRPIFYKFFRFTEVFALPIAYNAYKKIHSFANISSAAKL
jgi:lipid II:glycine glycyltransferase (peptidoglycan interpeptide bridge formation enzyme)